MVKAYIGLGSNLGEREHMVRLAAHWLDLVPDTKVARMSSLYETKPLGDLDQPDYLNAVVMVVTELSAPRLLWNLLLIENKLGRKRRKRWEPRPMDLDLLFYGDAVIDMPGLSVPHPEAHKRAFVLVPMAEVAPNFVHPVLGKTVSELLKELKPQGDVIRKGRIWQ